MDFSACKWIWTEDNSKQNDRAIFRRAFVLEKTPKSAWLRVCVRDIASIYVNGKPLALGVKGRCSFAIAKYLCKGDNVIALDCLYYGNPANGYVPPDNSGVMVACDELGIYSDAQFSAMRPYGENPEETLPTVKFPAFDSYTDGSRGELGDVFAVEFGSTMFKPATEYGDGGETEDCADINPVYTGEIRLKKPVKTTCGVTDTYVYQLEEEKTFYPVIELAAMGTERIEIKSNRYDTAGKWGDDNEYRSARGIYICRNGVQKYLCPVAFKGSALIITAPATVTVKSVDLLVSEYCVQRVLKADGCEVTEKLLDKCDNTMRACMDCGVWDNSDRDRGLDLFAFSLFARAAVFAYDDSVMPVIRESLIAAIDCGDGLLKDNPRSPYACEKPVSSLMFCSQFGAVASYLYRFGDDEILKAAYRTMCAYILRWEFEDGKLVSRLKDCDCVDAGYNADGYLIETCLYYSAIKFLISASDKAVDLEYEGELSRRAEIIEGYFDTRFYKDGFYSSSGICDERANALAVLSGLAKNHERELTDVLRSCHNASPAYEGFVIEALSKTGNAREAKSRLVRRYAGFAHSQAPVLPEYFYRGGSCCSTVSASCVSAVVSGILGINYRSACDIVIDVREGIADIKAEVPAGAGSLRIAVKRGEYTVENSTGRTVTVIKAGESSLLEKGKLKITL